MAVPSTTNEFLELVRRSGIHPPARLDEVLREVPDLPDDPAKSAAVLVKHGVLTAFQAKLLLTGRYRGFRLGAYVIREQIGQGGMGTVFLAEHETLRRRVAVKVLAPGEGMNRIVVERFQREARAAAALDHPNIVRLHDVCQQKDLHYLVMEYVDGQTLDKIVEQSGPIACGRAVEYITQAAAGLQHAYEKGFVHRDIKPGNLMLARDGTIKILDMGLARSYEKSDKLTEVMDKGAVVGTADYISPEQAMNHPDLDIRADVYSLGATFFTLVTGRPPFHGNTTQKLLQHQMKEAPSLASIDKTFPPGLSQVVAKMLSKKPAERYSTPAEVIGALAPWLPASTKVVAAISRTDMSRAPELQNTLSEVVIGGTKRLYAARHRANPAVYAAAALAAVVFLVGGAIAVYAALGGFSPSASMATVSSALPKAPQPADQGKGKGKAAPKSSETGKTQPDPKTEAKTPPTVVGGPTPGAVPAAPAPRQEGVAYHLSLAGRRKFADKGKVQGDPSRPTTKWVSSGKTGDGQFPPGWQPSATADAADYSGAVDDVKGSLAVGTRTAGSAAGTLLTPEVAFPSGKGKLTFEYLTETARGPVVVRFRATKPAALPTDVGALPPADGAWATHELDLDFGGATAGRFELVAGAGPKEAVWVRGFTAVDPVRPAGQTLLQLDTARLEPFVQRTIRFQEPGSTVPLKPVAEAGPGKMPGGWYRWIEFADTVAEFFADGPAGSVALGVQAVSGPGGVQINTPKVTSPDGRVKVRVLYQTGPASPGFVIRFRPDKGAIWDAATLPPTGGSWRLAVLDLDLRGSTTGLFELYNGASGPDAAVRVREFLVTDGE